jgi:hypothetical protein
MAYRIPFLAACFVATGGTLSAAQPDNVGACLDIATSAPPQSATTYGPRAGGAYCDGSIPQRHAGAGELPVIGLMTAVTGEPAASPVTLTVLLTQADSAGLAWPLRVQGVARSPRENYRLDAAIPSAARPTITVGPESAMSHLHMRADTVAWLAWADSPAGRTYIPVAGPASYNGALNLIVRPTASAAYVKYEVISADGHSLGNNAVNGNSGTGLGEPVLIPIPPGAPGLLVVNVLAVLSDGRRQAASIRLLRPGPAN